MNRRERAEARRARRAERMKARMRVRLSGVYFLLVALFLTAAVVIRAYDPFFVQALRLIAFDIYQRLSPQSYNPDLPVRVVDIDDASLQRIGQWPWPRTMLRDLLIKLHERKVAVVAFDVLFAEPDGSSVEQLVRRLPPAQAEALKRTAAGTPSNDEAFAAALRETPSVLALSGTNRPTGASPPKAGFAIAGDDPKPLLPAFPGIDNNLPVLDDAATGLGAINWIPNRDQVVRRVPLLFRVGDTIVPTLVTEALRVAQGASTYVLKSSNASGETALGQRTGLNHIKIGDIEIPTEFDGAMRLKFRDTHPAVFIPAWKLLAGEVDQAEIEGKIIFVGTSAPGLHDLRATPLSPAVPGVEIHAQVVEHILSRRELMRPDYFLAVEQLLLIGFGLFIALLLPRLPSTRAALGGLGIIALLNLGAWSAYQYWNLLFDPLYPSMMLLTLTAAITFYIYRQVETQRGEIRGAFGRYLAPAVVEELIANPDKLVLGGEVRELSLMFTDVRNFTSISEHLSAAELTQFINDLLTPLTDIILENRGNLDKYMGDAIMAFWNAPLDDPQHAEHAVRAAVEMSAAMDGLNERWRAEAEEDGREFKRVNIGIGINTGDCCVGNLGSMRRFDYSAIGDEVNVTSRLESLTKLYGLPAVIGEGTMAKCPTYQSLELDFIQVKGRTKPTRIYTLPVLLDDAEKVARLRVTHDGFLTAYRAQRWDEAEAAIAQCRAVGVAKLEAYYSLFMTRIGTLRYAGLPADWDGAYALTEK